MQTINSSLTSAKRSSRIIRLLSLAPRMLMTRLPACFRAVAMGRSGALPIPPPTQTTVPNRSIWVGVPSGPAMFAISSPSFRSASAAVVLPTRCQISSIVPGLGIGPRNGQRDALGTIAINTENDELAGLAGPGDQRRFDLGPENVFSNLSSCL